MWVLQTNNVQKMYLGNLLLFKYVTAAQSTVRCIKNHRDKAAERCIYRHSITRAFMPIVQA